MGAKLSSIVNAVRKAQKVRPPVYRLKDGSRIVAGSVPGQAYLVRVAEGGVACECQGFERAGVCYHAATVAMGEGLLDPWALLEAVAKQGQESQPEPESQPERPAREAATPGNSPYQRSGGRKALYG